MRRLNLIKDLEQGEFSVDYRPQSRIPEIGLANDIVNPNYREAIRRLSEEFREIGRRKGTNMGAYVADMHGNYNVVRSCRYDFPFFAGEPNIRCDVLRFRNAGEILPETEYRERSVRVWMEVDRIQDLRNGVLGLDFTDVFHDRSEFPLHENDFKTVLDAVIIKHSGFLQGVYDSIMDRHEPLFMPSI